MTTREQQVEPAHERLGATKDGVRTSSTGTHRGYKSRGDSAAARLPRRCHDGDPMLVSKLFATGYTSRISEVRRIQYRDMHAEVGRVVGWKTRDP